MSNEFYMGSQHKLNSALVSTNLHVLFHLNIKLKMRKILLLMIENYL